MISAYPQTPSTNTHYLQAPKIIIYSATDLNSTLQQTLYILFWAHIPERKGYISSRMMVVKIQTERHSLMIRVAERECCFDSE